MSIPTRITEFVLARKKAEAEYESDPEVARSLREKMASQIQMQKTALLRLRHKHCPYSSEKMVSQLSGLDAASLKLEVTQKFYNPEIMKLALCTASGISLPEPSSSNLSSSERIREWISNLRQIGADSGSGYALLGSLKSGTASAKNGDDFFVVKAPRDSNSPNELVHEAFVGLFALNSLRDRGVPNFAYIYGSFDCTAPFIDSSTKKVTTWCNKDKTPVTYCMYETIENIGSMKDMCANCTAEEFLQNYLAVMLATLVASQMFNYTHYDLHAENVMLRKVSDQTFWVPYTHRGRGVWVKANGVVPTIIDYGMTYVEVVVDGTKTSAGFASTGDPRTGPDSSSYSLRSNGVYSNKANPMHDAYKLLCMSLHQMKAAGNLKTYNKVKELLAFFESLETPDEIIQSQRGTYYFLPIDYAEALSLETYLDYLLAETESLGIYSTVRPTEVILGCRDSSCESLISVSQKVGLRLNGNPATPSSFLEMYDLIQRHIEEGKGRETLRLSDLEQIWTSFTLQLPALISKEQSRLAPLLKVLNSPPNMFFLPLEDGQLFDPLILEATRRFLSGATAFLDSYQRLELTVKVLDHFTGSFPDPSFVRFHQACVEVLTSSYSQSLTFKEHMLKQYHRLIPHSLLQASKESKDRMDNLYAQTFSDPEKEKYRWYWSTYKNLGPILAK